MGDLRLIGLFAIVAALVFGAKWQRSEGRAECVREHAAAAVKAEEGQRARERVFAANQQENASELQRQAARARVAVRNLDDAGRGLRDAYSASDRAAREATPAAAASSAADTIAGVQSLVRREVDERLRALAAIADDYYARGQACEREYDSVSHD